MNNKEALEFINQLTDHINKNDIEEISVNLSEVSIVIKKKPQPQIVQAASSVQTVVQTAPTVEQPKTTTDKEITSPIIGTFYAASAPDKAPFVAVGTTVNVGDIVCIVESMKLMNEIAADVAGVVEEILVKNGETVEFGQPLIRLK